MMPDPTVYTKLYTFTGALSILTGAMAWWRSGSAAEDAVVADAATTVLDALSDADTVGKIGCVTDKNLRDQVSIEEALELDRERRLRRFPNRN